MATAGSTGAFDRLGLRGAFRRLDALLVLVPIAAALELLHAPPVAVFALSGLAIIPLAAIMGRSTEQLAERVGPGIGGLLNATFGNAAELIIAIIGLSHGLGGVVKASITGSIIGNSLLVLGLAALVGGLKHPVQHFNRTAASLGSTMMVLAGIGMLVPTLFWYGAQDPMLRLHGNPTVASMDSLEKGLSVEIAIVLGAVYLLSLVFSLRTHKHLYAGDAVHPGSHLPVPPGIGGGTIPAARGGPERHEPASAARTGHAAPVRQPHGATRAEGVAPVRQPHAAAVPVKTSIVLLLVSSGFVALLSEFLVGALEPAARSLGLTDLFVGVIVVAIIGNAAEHSSAVFAAFRNQMDLAMHIAIGSSLQIALFVTPLLLGLSYLIGPGPIDLHFTLFEVGAVTLAVLSVSLVAQDGESNWMEGVLLLAVYAILGVAFFFMPA